MTDRRAEPPQGSLGYSHADPVTDAALDWFLRLRADPAVETSAAFVAWRDADPSHAEALARLQRLHASPALYRATERDAAAFDRTPRRSPQRHDVILPPPARAVPRRRRLGVAASLAAALAVLVWLFGPGLWLDWRADYRTAAGVRLTVPLPDGSEATLDTASAIALDFADGRRHVTLLSGTAYFDVRPDPQHPFVVSADYADVVARGTAFAVERAADADVVVLEHGAVDVERRGSATVAARLRPGQKVTARPTGVSPVETADLVEALSWREGRVVFRDRPLHAALAELARYYPGTVLLLNRDLGERRVSGNYRVDDAATAIATLATAAGAEMRRFPGKILILR